MSRDINIVEPVRAEPAAKPRVAPQLPDVDERSPIQLFWTLYQARVLISAITVAFVLLGIAYFVTAVPIYRSDVVLQVEESTKGIAGLSEISAALTDRTPADTEIEILRSRSLLESVVEQLNLEISASPRRMPIIGRALARGPFGAVRTPRVPRARDVGAGECRSRVSGGNVLSSPPREIG